jgi:F0F1-type ATP synthase assembly protein I
MQEQQEQNDKSWYIKFAKYSAISIESVAIILISILIGSFIDKKIHTDPWFLLVFLVFGLIGSIKILFKLMKNNK